MARIARSPIQDHQCSCLNRRPCHCPPSYSRASKHRYSSIKARGSGIKPDPFKRYIQLEDHFVIIEGPASPESLQSPESVSSVTSTTAELDYQRQISPVATPTSSELSFAYPAGQSKCTEEPSGGVVPFPASRPWWSGHQQTYVYTHIDNVTNPLAGIDRTGRPDAFVQRPVEFISRYGPSPTRLQSYPGIQEPWTGLPLRQDDPMLLDSPSDLTLSPDTVQSPTSSVERNSRRIGPLTAAQRRNANEVRQVRACLRCAYMKETCNEGTPCNNCQSKKNGRKWRLHCIREHLHERVEVLFPTQLKARYDKDTVNRYISQSAWMYSDRPEFLINLKTGLVGHYLRVQVKEIDLLDPHNTHLSAFQASTDPTEHPTKLERVWNPPIALYFVDIDAAAVKLRQQVGSLCNEVVFGSKEQTEYNSHSVWPWPCFDYDVLYWGGDILELIHDYHEGIPGGSRVLRAALCLPFFAYILGHPLMVPEEDVPGFLSQLSKPPPIDVVQGQTITSEITNRFVKMLLFPLVYEICGNVLKELHKILHGMAQKKETSASQSDLAFCLAFLMTMFLGKMQDTIHQLSVLNDQEHHIGITRTEAGELIRNMEDQLANYIIHFHGFALARRKSPAPVSDVNMSQAEMHAANFRLPEKVKHKMDEARENHEHPRSLELDKTITDTFTKWNTHRLCWKLCEVAFP